MNARTPYRLVGYTRVSTTMQVEDGSSLEEQHERIQKWCESQGHTLVRVCSDAGLSARLRWEDATSQAKKKKRSNARPGRPGLTAALATIARGEAEGLVFTKIDRLSRTLRDMLDLAKMAEEDGWHLCSVLDNFDTTTPIGEFTQHLLASLAQFESAQTRQRVILAMERAVRMGQHVSRWTPFGMRLDAPDGPWEMRAEDNRTSAMRKLYPNPLEAGLLLRMQRELAEGLSPYRIGKRLNQQGMLNPRGNKLWHTGSIVHICRRLQRQPPAAANVTPPGTSSVA